VSDAHQRDIKPLPQMSIASGLEPCAIWRADEFPDRASTRAIVRPVAQDVEAMLPELVTTDEKASRPSITGDCRS
jgi:hypothetical protein